MSRRDILDFIPSILNNSFVIIIDDADRDGENRTILDIQQKLHQNLIESHIGYYSGSKRCCVITSSDNKFICTL